MSCKNLQSCKLDSTGGKGGQTATPSNLDPKPFITRETLIYRNPFEKISADSSLLGSQLVHLGSSDPCMQVEALVDLARSSWVMLFFATRLGDCHRTAGMFQDHIVGLKTFSTVSRNLYNTPRSQIPAATCHGNS